MYVGESRSDDASAKMVLSYSSPVPHLVSKNSGGQYKCDKNSLNWVSSGMCSHSLAVAQLNGDIITFLQWYNASAQQPNITSVAMTGLPPGRGRKGGKPKKVRNHHEKRMPELTIPRPVFQASIPAASGTANVPPVISCTPVTSFCQSITSVGQVNVGSSSSIHSPVSHATIGMGQDLSCQPININPFYVKFIQGHSNVPRMPYYRKLK